MPLPPTVVAVETAPPADGKIPLAADLLSAMQVGDLDLSLDLGVSGASASPLTAGTAFVGWQQARVAVEFGAVELPDLTLSVGLEGSWSGRPVADALRDPNVRVGRGGDVQFRQSTAEVAARGAVHLTSSGLDWPEALDPFVFVTAGAVLDRYGVGFAGDADSWAEEGSAGVRATAGAGGKWLLDNGLFVGAEGAYGVVIGVPADGPRLIARTATEAAVWDREGASPRGFAWTGRVGMRF